MEAPCTCACHTGPYAPCSVPTGCGHLHTQQLPVLTRPARACITHRAPSTGGKWQLSDKGYLTCSACYERLAELLSVFHRDKDDRPDSIPGLYAVTDPTPGATPLAGGGRHPGFGPRSPANDHIISMRDPRSVRRRKLDPYSIPGMLWAWCRRISLERKMDMPTDTVDAMCVWLSGHLDWITRQPLVLAFYEDLKALHRQLKAVHQPRVSVGRCPNTIDLGSTSQACNARLYAPLHGDVVTCWSCGRHWSRRDWLRLGDLLHNGS